MEIVEYNSSKHKAHWLQKISDGDWSAAKFLHYLLKEDKFYDLVGENSRVLMLVENDELISFCTLAQNDDVQPTTLTPWIGFVYTFPTHRGKGYAQNLIAYAEDIARQDGAQNVYISTNHIGLYEKYGYALLDIMKDINGEDTRVYQKNL